MAVAIPAHLPQPRSVLKTPGRRPLGAWSPIGSLKVRLWEELPLGGKQDTEDAVSHPGEGGFYPNLLLYIGSGQCDLVESRAKQVTGHHPADFGTGVAWRHFPPALKFLNRYPAGSFSFSWDKATPSFFGVAHILIPLPRSLPQIQPRPPAGFFSF